MRVIGYVRVSTDEQAMSGAGLAAQRAAIAKECERRGWDLVETMEDQGFSARDLRRPGVQIALETLKRGGADGLVVAKLDRLSRSMLNFTTLMDTAQRQGWSLIALDCVDTTTPAGEAMAHVLATFSQFERRLIGQRTREALAMKKQQGKRLGRPPVVSDEIAGQIRRRRRRGWSYPRIAAELNEEGVPTAHGGAEWYPATVRSVHLRTTQRRRARSAARTSPAAQ